VGDVRQVPIKAGREKEMLPHHRNHPAPRHPCHHSTDRNVVVKKSSVAIIYPTLTRSNYTKWALVMQVNL
jgi:hypothetical protein